MTTMWPRCFGKGWIMSATVSKPRRFLVGPWLLTLILLLAVAGHFVFDAACLGGVGPAMVVCADDVARSPVDNFSASCGWHPGCALPVVLPILILVALFQPVRLAQPLARLVLFAPPLLPPKPI